MKFPDDAPVTLPKKTELRERLQRLGVVLGNVDEQAVKGTGPGGQKVNKTQSGVLLRYQLGDELLVIKWTRDRHHSLNRFLALRELCDEVEVRVSPATSARLLDIERARKQKDRTRRRQLARTEPEAGAQVQASDKKDPEPSPS
jgi:protein subunit release factor B